VKTALVMARGRSSYAAARARLDEAGGHLWKVLGEK
jgi:N-acetylmuramic acid 6-phosphate (MurNAc-6-P) etherase